MALPMGMDAEDDDAIGEDVDSVRGARAARRCLIRRFQPPSTMPSCSACPNVAYRAFSANSCLTVLRIVSARAQDDDDSVLGVLGMGADASDDGDGRALSLACRFALPWLRVMPLPP